MKIPVIYKKKGEEGRPVFSLEVFPPKRKSNRDSIYEAVEILKVTDPDFISVTYGAGGSVADFSTCEIASNIKKQYKIETLAHLTCINSSLEDVKTMIQMLKDAKHFVKEGFDVLLLRAAAHIEGESLQADAGPLEAFHRDVGRLAGPGSQGIQGIAVGIAEYHKSLLL